MSTLEHREGCQGAELTSYRGVPSNHRYAVTTCTRCGATRTEPLPTEAAVIVVRRRRVRQVMPRRNRRRPIRAHRDNQTFERPTDTDAMARDLVERGLAPSTILRLNAPRHRHDSDDAA